MAKTVFLFPGQGSQEVGMARDLFHGDEYFLSLIAQASRITGEDLARLCLKGPEKRLANARFLQPLIVAVSLGYLRRVQEKGIKPDYLLGHSLGEITALAAAGVISDDLAVVMAAQRGALMDEAAQLCDGAMMAVSAQVNDIEALIEALGLSNQVFISNINSPEQIVLSADKTSLSIMSSRIHAQGGKYKMLNIAGPWHSPYMASAYEKFKVWAKTLILQEPCTPIIFNAMAKPESNPEKIKEYITVQMKSPVHFKQCMEYLHREPVETFLEIGPGRVLSGLVRANGFMQGTKVFCVNDLRGVDNAARELSVSRDL